MRVGQQDLCSCSKPAGTYGAAGFHWRPDSEWPDHQQADIAVERCPQFQAAVQRRVDSERIASFRTPKGDA